MLIFQGVPFWPSGGNIVRSLRKPVFVVVVVVVVVVVGFVSKLGTPQSALEMINNVLSSETAPIFISCM